METSWLEEFFLPVPTEPQRRGRRIGGFLSSAVSCLLPSLYVSASASKTLCAAKHACRARTEVAGADRMDHNDRCALYVE